MKTIRIAFCDDDDELRNIIVETTKMALLLRGYALEAITFVNSILLLESVKANTFAYDVIMLEIDMPGIDGIMLCKQFARYDAKPDIIFISDNENRVFETFSVHPFSFIRKKRVVKDIIDTVNMFVDELTRNYDKILVVQTREHKRIVKLCDIMYIEGNKNYQNIVLRNQSKLLELRSTLDTITTKLEYFNFFRIHKGFLVNMRYIAEINKESVTLKNGITLPISIRKTSELSKRYMIFCRENGSIVL